MVDRQLSSIMSTVDRRTIPSVQPARLATIPVAVASRSVRSSSKPSNAELSTVRRMVHQVQPYEGGDPLLEYHPIN